DGRRKLSRLAGGLAAVAIVAVLGSAVRRPKEPVTATSAANLAAVQAREHRSGKAHFDLLTRFLADDRRGRDESEVLRACSDPASELRVPSQLHPLLDWPAPLFSLSDVEGRTWSLEDKLEHGPVVLVFYLNFGCDACMGRLYELNADIRLFQALGAEVAAISDDPPEL